jgi:hypothetical protein
VEPDISLEDQTRPDLLVTLGHRRFLVDVTVRNPAAPSHSQAGQSTLLVASQAERQKRAKYIELARARGAEFVPFVLETFGAVGKQAQDFMRKIASYASVMHAPWTSFEVRVGLISAVQIALQMGNAHVLELGYQRATQAVRGGPRVQTLITVQAAA